MQIVGLIELVDPLLVCNLIVVLLPIFTAEKDDAVLPLVAHPALSALHACPFGTRMHLEVTILRVVFIKDQFGVPKFACDNQRLHRSTDAANAHVLTTIEVVSFILHVPDLNSVRNFSRRILQSCEHSWVFLHCIFVNRINASLELRLL